MQAKPQQARLPFVFTPSPRAERRNLILEAGAGTGKTTSIVRELLEILLADPELSAERVVLVTFTEKAVGELSDRIRGAIACLQETALEGDARWPRDNPILHPAMSPRVVEACGRHYAQIDRFQSQTIHSFCQRLLRLHPLEARVNPQFAIVEGYERARLYEEIYGRWLKEETSSEAPETFRDWEIALTHLSRLDRIETVILGFLSKRDLILDTRYELGDITDAEPTLTRILGDIRSAAKERVAEVTDHSVRSFLDYIRENPDPEESSVESWIEFFVPVADVLSEVNRQRVKSFKTNFKFLRGDRGTIVERLKNHRAAGAMRRLASRFLERLDEEKSARGLLDFDDLLFRTAELLRDPGVLGDVSRRFDYFFIDEFQDTDRIQAEIIDRLSRDGAGRLVGGRTTIVGDPKQSIYSFRRADPETYQAFVEQFVREGAEKRILSEQHRSDPRLVETLNVMFSQLFSIDSSPNVARPVYDRLTPRKKRDESTRAGITFIRTDDSAQHESSDARQATAVARWIRNEASRSGKGFRSLALLFRKMTNIDIYLETLDRHGIPYVMPPTRAFLSRPAAVDLMAVLRAVAHPFDEAAVISAARTPYFAIHDDSIVRAYLFRDSVMDEFEGMKSTLERFSDRSRHISTASLTAAIIDESGVESFYAAIPGGDRSLLHLSAFRELAVEFDLNTGGSLGQFIDELYRRRAEEDESEPTWLEDSDAVAVMTIHASKGLEFDTVLLPDLSSRGGGDDVRLFAVDEPPSLLLNGKLTPLAAEFRESGGLPLSRIADDRLDAELDRLFYVGVTRARNEVIFVSDRDDKSSAFWKCLQRIFGLDPRTLGGYFDPQAPSKLQTIGVGFEKIEVRFEIPTMREEEHQSAPLRFVHPALAEILQARDVVDEQDSEEQGEPVLDRATVAHRRAASRNRKPGLLLHRVLEIWDGGEKSLPPLLEALSVEQQTDPAEKERVRRRLSTIRKSPHFQRVFSSGGARRELPIFYRDEHGALVEGRIDRLVIKGEGYEVVDYKSGRKEETRLAGDREQVLRYCRAVSGMTGKPCAGLVWYVDLESDELMDLGVVSCEL